MPGKSKTVSLKVPVKRHTAKFLAAQLGTDYRLTRLDPFGVFLHAVLRQRKRHVPHAEKAIKQYGARFEVHVSDWANTRDGVAYLSTQAVHDFNQFVERMYAAQLVTYVGIARAHGLEVEAAISGFNRMHGITEEDILLDTQKKTYLRHRRKTAKNTGNLSPAFNA